jgi:hypothetical protein
MEVCLVVVTTLALICLGSGCASTPKSLKDTGGENLKQCPKDLILETGENSVVLASIESDLLFDAFYFLLEKDTGAKYLMELKSRKMGMPTRDAIGTGRFKAKEFCYVISPGNYHITKIIGIMWSTGPGVTSSEKSIEFKHQREFIAPSNKVTYIGRYILLDPRMKEKGYFGRMGQMMGGMFSGSVLPKDIVINIVDGIEEDLAWLLDKYNNIRTEQVVNTTRQ